MTSLLKSDVATQPQDLQVHDLVEACGTRFIITGIEPSRPANPWLAIKERGNGAQYKLGYKHRPRKVGRADPDHPALRALQGRQAQRASVNPALEQTQRALEQAVLDGDLAAAQRLVALIRQLRGEST